MTPLPDKCELISVGNSHLYPNHVTICNVRFMYGYQNSVANKYHCSDK